MCSCGSLPGTILAGDGQRCEYGDDCDKDNGGCSHTCLTANGKPTIVERGQRAMHLDCGLGDGEEEKTVELYT